MVLVPDMEVTRDVRERERSPSSLQWNYTIHNYLGNSGAVIVRATKAGGIMTNLGDGKTATQYGFALELAKSGSMHEPFGGVLKDDYGVTYPIAVVTQDGSKHVYVVVSMPSPDEKVSADLEKG
jgi:hypothetical protein